MNTTETAQHAITWIDRLLVTRLKQRTRRLGNKKTGFCCLGLGCYINKIDYMSELGVNQEFTETVGLISNEGSYHKGGARQLNGRTLIVLNDNGKSFNQIAKAMKAEPEAYFTPEVAKLITEHYGESA